MQRMSMGLFCPCRPVRGFSMSHATRYDQHDIREVAATTFEETYREPYPQHKNQALFREFGDKRAIYLVAKHNDDVIGYAKMLLKPDESGQVSAYLDKLYILKEYCQQGYGSQLMERCKQEAIKQGATRMYLYVWVQNAAAIKFYQKHQFSLSGLTDMLIVDGKEVSGADAVVMACENLKFSLQPSVKRKRH